MRRNPEWQQRGAPHPPRRHSDNPANLALHSKQLVEMINIRNRELSNGIPKECLSSQDFGNSPLKTAEPSLSRQIIKAGMMDKKSRSPSPIKLQKIEGKKSQGENEQKVDVVKKMALNESSGSGVLGERSPRVSSSKSKEDSRVEKVIITGKSGEGRVNREAKNRDAGGVSRRAFGSGRSTRRVLNGGEAEVRGEGIAWSALKTVTVRSRDNSAVSNGSNWVVKNYGFRNGSGSVMSGSSNANVVNFGKNVRFWANFGRSGLI